MKTQDTPIDLSLTDWNGRETYRRNTANCYIIRNEGTFQIPLVYGNAIKDNQVNTESFYTPGIATDFQDSYGVPFNAWSSPFIREHASAQGKAIASADLLWNDGISKINNLSVDENFLTFDVESFSPCNALVAVKDNDGTVLWSWHLWLTNEDLTPQVITNAAGIDFKIMPCNLGWNGWTADGKPTSPYYQWGRKDPFIANEEPSEKGNIIYKFLFDEGLPQYLAHQNPKKFFHHYDFDSWTINTYPYFWNSKTEKSEHNQKVTKTIYDPCPIGWYVPQYNTFTGLAKGKATPKGRNCTTKDKKQNLFFPFAGYRYNDSGSVSGIGGIGGCWLNSSKDSREAHRMSVNTIGLNPNGDSSRGAGFSVRPALSE